MSIMWNMCQWISRMILVRRQCHLRVQRIIKDQENGNRTGRLTILGLGGKRSRTNSCNQDHMELTLSIQTCPNAWKEANVIPLPKVDTPV